MHMLNVKSRSRNELIDITADVTEYVAASCVTDGLCIVFTPHTTAAITINENADPDVPRDFVSALSKVFPVDMDFRHNEGNSDAHLKSSVVGCSELVIIQNGRPLLGTWQGLFFCEFDGPRNRKVFIKMIG
ncbi:secondary thiamine-phosphate synthase enzyme YjbQ [Desulforegula conservatrix]|uniref:secondary thiamine-phosphate synthase enzyme YjbQ n=1 Tax=Desulforegula conservatrix TaxID=153026 RepID=UPI0004142F7A|nr:secondary thiamine-phosphate synthase enzyme YjbQ [Desulforegula conservatrix]